MCLTLPVHGDVLLDLMYRPYMTNAYDVEDYDVENIDIHGAEPEWYSWDLGVNDSLPELVIIVDPYGEGKWVK
jgi:hypothetical protein